MIIIMNGLKPSGCDCAKGSVLLVVLVGVSICGIIYNIHRCIKRRIMCFININIRITSIITSYLCRIIIIRKVLLVVDAVRGGLYILDIILSIAHKC